MKKLIPAFLLAAFLYTPESIAQDNSGQTDKYILLTMPYNRRPLTLFRGQLQASSGYKFAVRAQSFNSSGELINLKTNGTGSVYHYYFAELRYGITDFIEAGIESDYLRRGIRDATTTTLSITTTATESVTVNKLTEAKGLGDLYVFTALRLPVEFRWFDLSLKGGMFLPTAKYEVQKPTNSVVSSLTATNTYTVNLHYNYTNGYGVPVYQFGAGGKISAGKWTLEASWNMRTPMKEGTNIRWEETLANKSFSYVDKSYSYLLSNTFLTDVSLHYQATGWFNVFINGNRQKSKGGWTEYWGTRYANPAKSIFNLEPGAELQISPAVIIYQVAGFPIGGKNMDAPFYLLTSVSFNLFPFRK